MTTIPIELAAKFFLPPIEEYPFPEEDYYYTFIVQSDKYVRTKVMDIICNGVDPGDEELDLVLEARALSREKIGASDSDITLDDLAIIAKNIRKLVELNSTNLDDDKASEVPFAYPYWKENHSYSINDRVRYNDILYKCLQTHRSQANWTPDVAPSLFGRILAPEGDIPEWEQPDSTNGYMIGDKVRFEGRIYESLIDNNVYSPAAYPAGWREIIE